MTKISSIILSFTMKKQELKSGDIRLLWILLLQMILDSDFRTEEAGVPYVYNRICNK